MRFGDYDDEMIERISESVDLVEYVSHDLELERKGDEYFAHCPKHTDNTASLSFTPATNKFYCFSCGRGGGIINYLRLYEGLSLDDAVNKAARLANMDLKCMCKSKTILFLKKMKRQKQEKQKFVHPILDYSEYAFYKKEPVQEWLDEGIQQDVLDLFDVRIDSFGNRIVYPVYDIDGNLINVKGRTRYLNYKSMGIPKYINYKPVGCMDYFQGLNVTLSDVKSKGEIIIFESIKSVMKAYGWGYTNCASAEKHTLTEEQIKLLLSLKVNVVFAYDSDISYRDRDVLDSVNRLKALTNVYVIEDRRGLLGGKDAKNAPVDLGKAIWEKLYNEKRRIA